MKSALRFVVLSALLCGCAKPGTAAAPQSAGAKGPAADGEVPEAAQPETDSGPRADVLYDPHPAVPPLADSCPEGAPLPSKRTCEAPREALAKALLLGAGEAQTALSELEGCDAFPVGLVRALRAEMGDASCADRLVLPIVGKDAASTEMPADIRETLVALGIGARLRRLAVNPPAAPVTREREPLQQYFAESLFPWISRQAQAIFEMASQGTRLSGYARGVVAIEAGNADMRFVEIAREAPIASEIAEHQEAKDLYYATLDERLEPRKARGRDAALVGLREMARLGVRDSERVASARRLISRAYGGRRVNALDVLLLPAVPAEKAEGAASAIASRVPTVYAASLVGTADPSPALVRAHMQMGMPTGLQRAILASGTAQAKYLLSRALFESGRTYFRAEDFQASHALLSEIADGASSDIEAQKDDILLLRALSIALSAGPRDATELLAKGPRFADSLGNLATLDALAEQPGEVGGRAAFAAAYLRELVAPEGAPEYWRDLGLRYLAASTKLKGAERVLSADRGKACLAIERELRKPR